MWNRISRRAAFCALLAGTVAPGLASGQTVQGKETPAPPKGAAKGKAAPGRVAGVIVKAVNKGGASQDGPYMVTVNADILWSDWVRDQATVNTVKTTDKAARAGAKSVATEGQPKDEDNLVVIEVGPDSKIETRYRASTDETSKGSPRPAGAKQGAADPAVAKDDPSKEAKPLELKPGDLKDGLFVEVDFKTPSADRNLASSIVVLRPIGGPDTAADAAPDDATKPK